MGCEREGDPATRRSSPLDALCKWSRREAPDAECQTSSGTRAAAILRRLIARYGPETSLAFWEFWNETDAPAPWVREMAAYLKQNDPYLHLVTNSYSTVGTPAVWNLPEIDLTQTHRYGDEGTMKDIAPVILDDARLHDLGYA